MQRFPVRLALMAVLVIALPGGASAVDEAPVAAAGIRKLPPSKRITLYTDLPASAEIDALPAVFDQAFDQWCAYFHVDPARHADWHVIGCLMKDRQRFRQAGLLGDGVPEFPHGYSIGHKLWLFDKPSDYYRRHLLLHEGTHAFMNTILGSTGPPWYAEGTAELLGTHRLDAGRLVLGAMPARREDVPEWGRIRIIKDALAARRGMRLPSVLDYSATAHREVEPYAWCWAAAYLLDRHPRYQERFRQLYRDVNREDFNERFRRAFAADWQPLNEEWAVFITGLEYGYDVSRSVIDFTPGRPCPAAGATVEVAAARGWQNSGLVVTAGQSYRLTASGRYQVGKTPQVWWSEPGGVSIRYYKGQPLGVLLAAVRPERPSEKSASGFLRPTVVGLGTTLRPAETGTLYFKINHSAAELRDNAGEVKVEVKGE